MGTQIIFVRSQIATPQIFGLIPPSQIRKFLRCSGPQICKFVMIIAQIGNPQISLVSQSANRKSANQGEKKVFPIHIRIGLPLIFF
jgi:hypothetical protein